MNARLAMIRRLRPRADLVHVTVPVGVVVRLVAVAAGVLAAVLRLLQAVELDRGFRTLAGAAAPWIPRRRSRRSSNADSSQSRRGRTPAYDRPMTSESETDLAHLDEIEAELDDVEKALERLDDGTYGTCEVCGAALPDEQLAAAPAARRAPSTSHVASSSTSSSVSCLAMQEAVGPLGLRVAVGELPELGRVAEVHEVGELVDDHRVEHPAAGTRRCGRTGGSRRSTACRSPSAGTGCETKRIDERLRQVVALGQRRGRGRAGRRRRRCAAARAGRRAWRRTPPPRPWSCRCGMRTTTLPSTIDADTVLRRLAERMTSTSSGRRRGDVDGGVGSSMLVLERRPQRLHARHGTDGG